MANEIIRENVNKFCVLKTKAESIKKEMDELEAFFLLQSKSDLKDTKIKTVSYMGDMGNCVSATMAATVKMEHPTLLRKAFGDEYKGLVSETIAYSFSANAKRMLAGLYLKNYTKETVEGVLKQIGVDSNTYDVLTKKVKGVNFKKDVANLCTVAKLDKKEAQYFAYFVSEAAVWESFNKMIRAKGDYSQQKIEECLNLIDGSIIVEETPKIAIEASK